MGVQGAFTWTGQVGGKQRALDGEKSVETQRDPMGPPPGTCAISEQGTTQGEGMERKGGGQAPLHLEGHIESQGLQGRGKARRGQASGLREAEG